MQRVKSHEVAAATMMITSQESGERTVLGKIKEYLLGGAGTSARARHHRTRPVTSELSAERG